MNYKEMNDESVCDEIFNSVGIVGKLFFVLFAVFFAGMGIINLIKNFDLIVSGNSIDLNAFVVSSYADEESLPIGENVHIETNKYYGFFAKHKRTRRSFVKYYYVSMLDDNSLIVVEALYIDSFKLNSISNQNLSLKRMSTDYDIHTGELKALDSVVADEYISYVNELKNKGVIDKDINVRNVMITGGGRFSGFLVSLFSIGACVIFLIIGLKNEILIQHIVVYRYIHSRYRNITNDGQLDIAEKDLIRLIKYTRRKNKYYDKHLEYVYQLVMKYIKCGKYAQAAQWLKEVDENDLISRSSIEPIPGYDMVKYYNLKMKICRGMRDRTKAEEIMNVADEHVKKYREVNAPVGYMAREFYDEYANIFHMIVHN